MQHSVPPDAAPLSALHADLSASSIDVRCALILARVALKTMAATHPESLAALHAALDEEAGGARLEQADGADAVLGMVAEMKADLEAAAGRVWYIE